MSKRAEEFACKYAGFDAPPTRRDELENREKCDIFGACLDTYEQAEQDLALTWEDIKVIYEIFDALDNEHHSTFNMGIQQYFQEALRRFRETKNK